MEEHLIFEAVPHETPMGWIIDNIPQCKFSDWVDELNDTGYLKLYLEFDGLEALADFRNALKRSPFYDYTNFKEQDRAFIKSLAEMIVYISQDMNHRCESDSACLYSGLSVEDTGRKSKGCAVGWFFDQEWAKKVDDFYGGLSWEDLHNNLILGKNPRLLESNQIPIQLIMDDYMFVRLQDWHDCQRGDMTEQTKIDSALEICADEMNASEFNYLKSVI